LLARESTQPGPWTRAHLGRLGAEERGSHGERLARYQREVERQVMALEPPAPARIRPRSAEHADRVVVGIAHQATEGLHLAQHTFQADHVRRLGVARSAQARLHQLVLRDAPGARDLLERMSLAPTSAL